HTDFQSVALPTELPALNNADSNDTPTHVATKYRVIYIRQMPVARKLQENFAIFSHDGQEPDEEGTKLPKRYLS
ncbi:MAG: hypothetical protein ACYSWO_24095, partial [Planctomycetota bacterium]